MKAVYRFRFTADVLVEGLRRWRGMHVSTSMLWLHRMVLVAACAILGAITFNSRYPALSVAVCLGFGYLLFRPWIQDWQTRSQFTKSPYRDENMVIVLSDEGFQGTGDVGRTALSWQAFTKAVRFSDGFLLLQGPGVFNWLPDTALSEGNVAEIELLLLKHVASYQKA
jgi:hypothetical protein